MNTKVLKNFAYSARKQMDMLFSDKDKIKSAFVNAIINCYANKSGIPHNYLDDSCVPENILNTLSSDILSGEFVNVEVLGWLYQYFVDADRSGAVDVISGVDIEGESITAATQVFTPGWIVRYLTDNSLGKYFAAAYGENVCMDTLKSYFPSQHKLPQIKKTEEITFFDPCCGSGNILLYAFDVFMHIYTLSGVTSAEAAKKILTFNIFGADIDSNAVLLAKFSIRAKAALYGCSIADEDINICCISDDGGIGSLNVDDVYPMLCKKYSVVCTNPPYLGRIGGCLKKYLNEHMKPYSKDLFTAFIYRGLMLCEDGGYLAYLTPNVWMYLSTHRYVRDLVLSYSVDSLVQLGKGAFFSEASVDLSAFVVRKSSGSSQGIYIRSSDGGGMLSQQNYIENRFECLRKGEYSSDNIFTVIAEYFDLFPDRIMAFYAPESIASLFGKKTIGDVYTAKQGMTTGDNKRFVKYWYEVPYETFGFGMKDTGEASRSGKKWFPYNKGGKYRKWYGNNDFVVMYENDGEEMKSYTATLPQGTWVRLKSREYYFCESVTWSFISSSHFGVRYSPGGSIFDVAGSSLFGENLKYVLGFLTTKTAFYLLQLINPTMNYQIRDIRALPFIIDENSKERVQCLVDGCIDLSRKDCECSELTYDFKKHPLLLIDKTDIETAVKEYIAQRYGDFNKLMEYENELNYIFSQIYSVESVISHCIEPEDITLKVPDESECIHSLLSYAAGCAFGRYNPHKDGVLSTQCKFLSVEQLASFVNDFVGECETYIYSVLKCDIYTYFKKQFIKKHFNMYRKRPLYTLEGNDIYYFKKI